MCWKNRHTTPAVLAAVAREHPDRTFVIAEDGELTYGMTARRVHELARHFAALGLRPGERVGLLLPNGARWIISYLAAHAAGLVVVPLNTWYREAELAKVTERAELRLIVTEDYLATLDPEAPDGDPLEALENAPVTGDDDALVLFTSGSSAEPKAVRLTQRGIVTNAYAVGERQGVREGDRIWFGSPLFFVYGCANAIVNTLTHAITLCVQERFEAAAALAFIERHRCTVYYGVAPITRALAACEDLARRDISSLRTGTGNATPEDLRLTIEVLGVREVCNAYGLTEGYGHSTITAHTDPPEVRMTSQGTALPTQEIRIVADGGPAGADVPGEIQIRGTVTPGYLDSPGAFTGDGWFRTGDVGSLGAAGRLTYAGRANEMMKVKGINISPVEVELVLAGHPGVDDAYVFGVPTPEGDEEVGCVLVSTVPRTEHGVLVAEVQEFVRAHAASYKVPTNVRVLTADQLPLTATGKVSRRALKEGAR
ncbi:class I adenylate-forming enzyme family protein [Amycolatopsis sp. GM8]|uniref:class I adenylate-forming enzyme family protein n=1 Tax=Amycolatopsis sp. GM8 TaxID=2896530 RepID=UPI001F33BA95|nr:class I adenylate-forming enzyme family protein [Amycolatopsis sp. GM8]